MPGPLIAPGVVPTLPGIYFSLAEVSQQISPVAGVVAAVFRADDGPLAQIVDVTTLSKLYDTYGQPPGQDSNSGVEVVAEALRGGASRVRCWRAGSSGVKASKILSDTQGTPAQALDLTWANVGKGGNLASVTVEDSIDDPSGTREFTLFYDGVEKLVIRFAKGGAEAVALRAAIVASGTTLLTAAIHSGYVASSPLAAIASPSVFSGGTQATVNSAAVEAGLAAFEAVAATWNVITTDSVDTSIQAALVEAASLWEGKGIYRFLALGDPPSATPTVATRYGRAAAFNQSNLIYVIDAFEDTDGDTVEGGPAAGRVAGMVASADKRNSITGRRITGAADLPSALTVDDLTLAIENGAITFRFNDKGQVTITQGITTWVVPTEVRSSRWGKIVRVARRYGYLIEASSAISDLLFGGSGVDNDDAGRANIIGAVLGVIQRYRAQRYFQAGTAFVDPDHESADDLAYIVHQLTDNDQVERLIQSVQFP